MGHAQGDEPCGSRGVGNSRIEHRRKLGLAAETGLRGETVFHRNNSRHPRPACARSGMPTRESLPTHFSLGATCARYRDSVSAQVDFISLEGRDAAIVGFSEYTRGLTNRLSDVRPAKAVPGFRPDRCANRSLALALQFSSDNLYHLLWHALPAYHALAGHAQADAVFLPIGTAFPGGRPKATPFAWEFALRSLTAESSATLSWTTQQLMSAGRCTCFDRVEGSTGGGGALSPHDANARPHMHALRRAALRNAAALLPPRGLHAPWTGDMLYLARSGSTRRITNEAVFLSELSARHPSASARVRKG